MPIALVLLVFVGWINLRGMSESGRLFSLPVYAFIAMVALLVGFGLVDLVLRHGFVPEPTPPVQAIAPLSLFLVLRAFSSGCSAMTGIEAIANGVQVFRDPAAANARATMAVMGLILSLMFLGISLLAWMYGVDPSSNQTTMAINLYAVGVFLAFTMSQSGMVIYWLRQRGSAWRWRALMNGFGALFTCLVLAVVVFSKFSSGAWLVVLLIPSLVWILALIKKRYGLLQHALELDESAEVIAPVLHLHSAASPARPDPGQGPIVVCLEAFDRAAVAAVRQACSMSRQVSVLFVYSSHHNPQRIRAQWDRQIGQPLGVALTLKESPYASFIDPLVEMVHAIERGAFERSAIDGSQPEQRLTVMMPEVISTGWLDGLLLNQSVDLVSAALRDRGSRIFSRYRYYLQV